MGWPALLSADETPRPTVHAGEVVGVIDGDTIDVLVDDEPIRIRLDGIDAPERGQAFGSRAKKALSDAVFGKDVRVIEVDTDRYGRVVGRVYLRRRDVSLAMVNAGLAWHYTQFSDDEGLAEAQRQARDKRLGLWVDDDPTPPWEYRRQQRTEAAE